MGNRCCMRKKKCDVLGVVEDTTKRKEYKTTKTHKKKETIVNKVEIRNSKRERERERKQTSRAKSGRSCVSEQHPWL